MGRCRRYFRILTSYVVDALMAEFETPAVVHLAFFARKEQNGTYTLCLDAAESKGLPVEIGAGFETPDAIIAALTSALTSPAVAEDRMAAVEEYAPALNAAIDSVNEQGEAMQGLNDRLRELEAWRTELERQNQGYRPPTRPAIPRVGGGARQPAPSLRRPLAPVYPENDVDEPYQESDPEVLPVRPPAGRSPRASRSIVGPSSLDDPRPDFNRGEFKPHQPVGRVGRGPNSVG